MSAAKGWIGEPQPVKEWYQSIYSRQGDQAVHGKRRQDGLQSVHPTRAANGGQGTPGPCR